MATKTAKEVIANVRTKYPQYNKLNDYELLGSLKKKYPQYNHLVLNEELPKTENVLHRASKSIQSAIGGGIQDMRGMQVNPKFPFLPSGGPMDSQALSSGMGEARMPITKGNPAAELGMDFASNVLAGGGLTAKPITKGLQSGIRNLKEPSKVFGEKLASMQKDTPKKIDFFSIINDGLSDPMAKKVIDKSGVMERYGGTKLTDEATLSENLSNLNLDQAQDLVNSVKAVVKQGIKEGTVKSNERGIVKLMSDMTKAQDAVFPQLKGARKAYGFATKLSRGVKSAKKTATRGAIYGAGLGTGGATAYSLLRGFDK